MAEPTSYPSYVYNAVQGAARVVQSKAELDALASEGPGEWSTDPFPSSTPASAPADPPPQEP